jgi:N-acetylglucosamine malate deacetylase 1
MKRVLVLSPHPDDESIGCGGTLRKHVVDGDDVVCIFLTSGERGGHGRPPEETRRIREQEATCAAEILGLSSIEFWRERNGGLRITEKLVSRLTEKIRSWSPDILYLPHDREMHPEHRAAVRLVRRVLARIPPPDRAVVWMFEVWTPLQRMDQIVDISQYMDTKIAAVRAHKSQCSVVGFDEACLGLNRYRGELHSWPGGDYAEVFAELRRDGRTG